MDHGLLQARILEWVAISFSRGSSSPSDRIRVSCLSCNGRQILYHCTTWEAPSWWKFSLKSIKNEHLKNNNNNNNKKPQATKSRQGKLDTGDPIRLALSFSTTTSERSSLTVLFQITLHLSFLLCGLVFLCSIITTYIFAHLLID